MIMRMQMMMKMMMMMINDVRSFMIMVDNINEKYDDDNNEISYHDHDDVLLIHNSFTLCILTHNF